MRPQEALLAAFDAGQLDTFVRVWSSRLPPDMLNDAEAARVYFLCRVHFATLPLRSRESPAGDAPVDDGAESKTAGEGQGQGRKNTTQAIPASLQRLQEYFSGEGAELASVTELVPYFALPHALNPVQNESFSELFSPEWVPATRARLAAVLEVAFAERELPRIVRVAKAHARSHSALRRYVAGMQERDEALRNVSRGCFVIAVRLAETLAKGGATDPGSVRETQAQLANFNAQLRELVVEPPKPPPGEGGEHEEEFEVWGEETRLAAEARERRVQAQAAEARELAARTVAEAEARALAEIERARRETDEEDRRRQEGVLRMKFEDLYACVRGERGEKERAATIASLARRVHSDADDAKASIAAAGTDAAGEAPLAEAEPGGRVLNADGELRTVAIEPDSREKKAVAHQLANVSTVWRSEPELGDLPVASGAPSHEVDAMTWRSKVVHALVDADCLALRSDGASVVRTLLALGAQSRAAASSQGTEEESKSADGLGAERGTADASGGTTAARRATVRLICELSSLQVGRAYLATIDMGERAGVSEIDNLSSPADAGSAAESKGAETEASVEGVAAMLWHVVEAIRQTEGDEVETDEVRWALTALQRITLHKPVADSLVLAGGISGTLAIVHRALLLAGGADRPLQQPDKALNSNVIAQGAALLFNLCAGLFLDRRLLRLFAKTMTAKRSEHERNPSHAAVADVDVVDFLVRCLETPALLDASDDVRHARHCVTGALYSVVSATALKLWACSDKVRAPERLTALLRRYSREADFSTWCSELRVVHHHMLDVLPDESADGGEEEAKAGAAGGSPRADEAELAARKKNMERMAALQGDLSHARAAEDPEAAEAAAAAADAERARNEQRAAALKADADHAHGESKGGDSPEAEEK